MNKTQLSIERQTIKNKRLNFSIKTGDKVKVIAGNDRGKTGEVLKVIKKAGHYALVRGINLKKKVLRTQSDNSFSTIESKIHISNIVKID